MLRVSRSARAKINLKKGLGKATQIKGKNIKEKQKHPEQRMPPSREQAPVQSQHSLGSHHPWRVSRARWGCSTDSTFLLEGGGSLLRAIGSLLCSTPRREATDANPSHSSTEHAASAVERRGSPWRAPLCRGLCPVLLGCANQHAGSANSLWEPRLNNP